MPSVTPGFDHLTPAKNNKNLQQRLLKSEQRLASMLKNHPKPKQPMRPRVKGKRPSSSAGGRTSSLQEIAKPLVALVDPNNRSLTNLVGSLNGPLPSQKVRSTGATTFTLAAGSQCILVMSPNPSNDRVSVWGYHGTPGDLGAGTIGAPGANVSLVSVSTPSPYTAATLAGRDFSWKHVSSHLRLKYEGSELNRSGRVYILQDPSLGFWKFNESANGTTPGWSSGTIIGSIGYSATNTSTVRKCTFNQASVIDVVHASNADNVADYYAAESANSPFFWPDGAATYVVAPLTEGKSNAVINVGATAIVFTNTSTAPCTYELEVTSTFEYRSARDIDYLHTTLPSHPQEHSQMMSLKHAALARHHQQPHLSLGKLVKSIAGSSGFQHMIRQSPLLATAVSLL